MKMPISLSEAAKRLEVSVPRLTRILRATGQEWCVSFNGRIRFTIAGCMEPDWEHFDATLEDKPLKSQARKDELLLLTQWDVDCQDVRPITIFTGQQAWDRARIRRRGEAYLEGEWEQVVEVAALKVVRQHLNEVDEELAHLESGKRAHAALERVEMLSDGAELECNSPMKESERSKYLKQIAGLALAIAERGGKYKRGEAPNVSNIAELVHEVVDDLPEVRIKGMGETSLSDSISEGLRLLRK